MKKIIILLIILLVTQIIVFAERREAIMNDVMESWQGQKINSLIGLWGQPSKVDNLEDGQIYYWVQADYIMTASGKKLHDGKDYCTKMFQTDGYGNITNWQYKGASCKKQIYTNQRLMNQNTNNYNDNTDNEN